ncbi:MAG TPA: penicillin acylase family protein [Spirochaetota bacterium]|nr:penicillin acylase family protein [Spirochaetota bacterium]HPR47157.1 penicillin acylase family protein [Spirochaetota bacterium]
MKKTLIISACVCGALLLVAGAGYLYYKTQMISYEADIVSAVRGDVIIERDSQGVPKVDASSEEDLSFALGYLHAQDRFVYMEYYRAIARSELSRLTGESAGQLDRFAWTIGFRRKAAEIVAALGEKETSLLDAYVKGIGVIQEQALYKNSLDEPWDRVDVVAVLLLKEWCQAFLNNRELLYQLSDDVKKKNYRYLREIIPPEHTYFYNEDEKKSVTVLRELKRMINSRIGSFNRGFAVYLPGYLTKEGKSFTAYSYEDRLSTYPGWYPVSISFSGKKILAVTHAGLPFLMSGTAGEFSFFGFSLNCDVQDFVLEPVRNSAGVMQYQSAAGWKNFSEVRDSGMNTGRGPVWKTDNGPVLNDIIVAEPYKNHVVTVKSAFPGPDYITSLLELPFSDTMYEAVKKIRGIHSLPRVYLFADDKNCVTAYSGRVPRRQRSDSIFKRFYSSYWYGDADLSSLGDNGNRTSAAGTNFMVKAPAYLNDYLLADEFRYGQLMNLLGSSSDFTKKEFEKLMNDNHSAHAAKFTPVFLLMLEHNPITSSRLTRIYFNDWKFDMDPNLVAPTLFQSLLQSFIYETLKDELKEDIGPIMDNYVHLLPSFLKAVVHSASPFFDDSETYAIEGRDAIFDRSFLETMRALNRKNGPIMDEWKWGSFHRGHFNIPFSEKSLVSRIIYKISDGPIPGGNSTVCYSSTSRDLRPLGRSSLIGYYYHDSAGFTMNYSYSINPMSPFYYGKMGMVSNDRFSDVKGRYLTRIIPASSR